MRVEKRQRLDICSYQIINEYKGIRDLIYTIVKMMIVEKFEKPKLQFPINQPLFIICLYI